MMTDPIEVLHSYEQNPKKWAKLASDVHYRQLHLQLLKEIALQLKCLNQTAGKSEEQETE